MKTTCMLLLHHWRRTRLWLVLPLLVSIAWTLTVGHEIARSNLLSSAWDTYLFSMTGNAVILIVGTLGLVVAMGSGESNAAFPRYAQTMPVSDRRWSAAYILYTIIVFTLIASFITLLNGQSWRKAVANAQARIAAEEKQAQTRPHTPPSRSAFKGSPQTLAPGLMGINASSSPFFKVRRAAQPLNHAMEDWQASRHSRARNQFRRDLARFSSWREILFLVSVVFFCQSLLVALTLIPRMPVRAFSMAVALITVPAGTIILSLKFGLGDPAWPLWRFFHAISIPSLLLLLGCVVLHYAARRERHGGLDFHRVAQAFGASGQPGRRFDSPARALAWYDWMTFGRYLFYGAFGVTIACAAIGLMDNNEITGIPFLPACAMAGLYLAYRMYYGDRHDNDAYLITLPVTVERLAKSRLINVTKAVAAAFVVAIIIETAAVIFRNTWPPESNLFILPAAVFAWMLIWLIGPLFYPAAAAWLFTAALAVFLPKHSEVTAVLCGVGLFTLALVAGFVWLARRVKRTGLIFGWNRNLAVLAWVVAAVVAVPALWFQHDIPDRPAVYAITLGLCLMPSLPFLALPAAIDRYRHR